MCGRMQMRRRRSEGRRLPCGCRWQLSVTADATPAASGGCGSKRDRGASCEAGGGEDAADADGVRALGLLLSSTAAGHKPVRTVHFAAGEGAGDALETLPEPEIRRHWLEAPEQEDADRYRLPRQRQRRRRRAKQAGTSEDSDCTDGCCEYRGGSPAPGTTQERPAQCPKRMRLAR